MVGLGHMLPNRHAAKQSVLYKVVVWAHMWGVLTALTCYTEITSWMKHNPYNSYSQDEHNEYSKLNHGT